MICLAAIAVSGCGGATHGVTPTTGAAPAGGATRLRAGVELVYAAGATSTGPAARGMQTRAAAIIGARLRGLAPGATVRTGPRGGISVFLPGVKPGAPVTLEVGATGALEFYDWEADVIGPTGRPSPTDAAVTGGSSAGSASYGITLYEAVVRASKRPGNSRKNDTTPGGVWYLVDKRAHKVVGGPAQTEAALTARHRAAPASTVVHVRPGTVIVQGERSDQTPGPTLEGYHVLDDAPLLGSPDVTDPREAVDSGAGGSGQPSVTFSFTSDGRRAFQAMTKVIARRGAARSAGGRIDLQHFAIVLDNRVISVPAIDFNQYPAGVDARNGSEIAGGFTVASARLLAAMLATGPLPVALTLVSERPSSA